MLYSLLGTHLEHSCRFTSSVIGRDWRSWRGHGREGNGLGGLADHQLGFEADLAVLVCLIVGGLVEEQPGRGAAELVARLPHARERNGGRGGEVDVVVPDDRDVLGDPDMVAGHLLQHAERDQVVGTEHGAWPGRDQHRRDRRARTLPAAHVERVGVDHAQIPQGTSGPAQGAQCPRAPVGHLADGVRAADVGDVLGAGGQQVRYGQVAAEHHGGAATEH